MQDGDCRLGKGNRNAELFLVVVVNIPYRLPNIPPLRHPYRPAQVIHRNLQSSS